ncbi:MAG: hypothetical protein QM703_02385 [Gemmatales bacterium]
MEEAIKRGWEDLIGRADGLMHFRIILQPAVAIFFAIRAGLRDARQGKPAFLWTVYADANQRRALLREGWKDVGMVFCVALVLDAIYQVISHSSIYTLELLVTATLLAIVPYVIVRGPVTRLAQRFVSAKPPVKKEITTPEQPPERKGD